MPPTVNFSKLQASDRAVTGATGSRELRYLAQATGTGLDDLAEIRIAAEAWFPGAYDGMGGRQIQVDPINAEGGLWEITASYRPTSTQPTEPPPAGADSEYTFEVVASTVHITQSRETVSVHSPSGSPVPSSPTGAIGLTPDGVEGCDIMVPESRWSETHFLSDSFVTLAYMKQVRELVGKTNNATFRGHAAGEVLLIGVTGGQRRADGVWQLTYQFAFSPNATGLVVGTITGIDKKGWEYLWVYYEPVVDAGQIIQRPALAFVERVYDAADYSLLGI